MWMFSNRGRKITNAYIKFCWCCAKEKTRQRVCWKIESKSDSVVWWQFWRLEMRFFIAKLFFFSNFSVIWFASILQSQPKFHICRWKILQTLRNRRFPFLKDEEWEANLRKKLVLFFLNKTEKAIAKDGWFCCWSNFSRRFQCCVEADNKKFNSFEPYEETKSTLDSFHALNFHGNLENVYLLTRMGNNSIWKIYCVCSFADLLKRYEEK